MDVDIDLKRGFKPEEHFNVTRASRVQNKELKPHNVGVYFQPIPVDGITGLSAIPYDKAEAEGFFKIDFLGLQLLDPFESKSELRKYANMVPDWNLLLDHDVVSKLFQLHNHFKILNVIKPRNIDELADTIALIRPDKKYLLAGYLKNPELVRARHLYIKEENSKYSFKRSHSIAYAINIVVQLNLAREGKL
jgi:DNA polymerase III alpha subunit